VTHKTYAFRKPAAVKKLEKALEFLAEPHSAQELAEHLHLAKRTTVQYLDFLRGVERDGVPPGPRRVRIADWRVSDRPPIALFQVITPGGRDTDKRRPNKRTVTERRRDLREKLRVTDPDELARRNAERQLKRRGARRDPMIEALFGKPSDARSTSPKPQP
jgi:hypothetical protein